MRRSLAALAALALVAVLPSALPALQRPAPRIPVLRSPAADTGHRGAPLADTTRADTTRADTTRADTARSDTANRRFAALAWRNIGPARGGRSVAVAGSRQRPNEYWMGTTGGGVYKTTDGGLTWRPASDGYFGGTIGAIAVSESNPDIVYVGTGESPIRGNVSPGNGVWKTTDGGKTWTHVGLERTQQISRVRVDPTNPRVVYVGAQGEVWAPNPERGVYKSTDGGTTWRKVLFRNDSTGITDLVLDPTNPRTLYAAFWQAGRKPWLLVSGGAGSGIFRSTDAGETWTELTRNPGLPRGTIGNIGLAVSPAKPARIWALVEADSGGIFRSDDGGATWTKLNDDRNLRQRAWYYTRIFADPVDTNTVYVANVQFWRSKDGGRSFKPVRTPHSDNHDLWIAPDDPRRMIEANDGGANVSRNAGASWTDQAYATGQFYHVTTTNDFPYQVCGAQQDNSTVCIRSRAEGGIGVRDWEEVGGGESGYIAVRPDSTNIVYAGSYGGLLTRRDRSTGLERDVNPWPDNPMGHSAGELEYRFNWTFPIVIPPTSPRTLYVGSNVLFRSTNGGQSYTVASPDLTRADPATLGASGGPITKDQTSVEYYATIFAIAPSPVRSGVIWTGSDDGLIYVTRDGGARWTNVTPRGLPPFTRISIIDASPLDAGTAYVAANRYQLDDMAPYLYRTTDYGATWTRIDSGIPRDEFTRAIRADPARRGLLYAGTERGVWVSFSDGARWESLQRNLPVVPVHDLAVKEGDLVAATHGRAFWILDDLSALRQRSSASDSAAAFLFRPRAASRAQFGGRQTGVGANPPDGASVYYSLATPNQEVTLEFLDSAGRLIKRFTSRQDSAAASDSLRADSLERARTDSLTKAGLSPDSIARLEQRGTEAPVEEAGRRGDREPRVPNKQGLNRFAWNLRYPDAVRFRGMILWAGGTRGPLALPGRYTVRMLVAGRPAGEEAFRVVADPRSPATRADLAQQFALLVRIRDALSAANNAVRTIRNVAYQLEGPGAAATAASTAAATAAATANERPRQGADIRSDAIGVAGTRGTDTTTLAPPTALPGEIGKQSRALLARLRVIEDSLYQTQNRSSQDPLNFPIRLNNKIAALSGVVARANGRPTAQSYTVFRLLSAQLDRELALLRTALGQPLERLNQLLVAAERPAVVPSTAELGPAPSEPVDDEGAAEPEEEARWW